RASRIVKRPWNTSVPRSPPSRLKRFDLCCTVGDNNRAWKLVPVTDRESMPTRQRADRLLVERGLFESRAKAQAAIEAGLVIADDEVVSKASEEIRIDAALFASAAHPYVSRGGVKLAAALDHFNFNPKGRICLDVGASTGGFTEVLLDRGARRIYAVDVGRRQLHDSLHIRPEV